MIDMELATAQFEATWLEVRYHEEGASVAEVEAAIRRVDALRRVAATMAHERAVGESFSWRAPEVRQIAGH
jgi:hypothetical protein